MLNLLKAIILNKDHLLNCCMPSSSLLSVQWLNQVHYRVCCFCILILYSLFSVMLLWYLIRCDRHYEQMTSLTKCSKSPFGSPAAFYLKRSSCSCLVKEKEGILFIGFHLFSASTVVFEKQEFLVFFALFTLIALFNEQCIVMHCSCE
jgi:hypothetical protein